MASFISALSLLILVLANVCFTVPVVDEQSWSSTLSSLNDELTTEKVLHLSLVSDDETTVLPILEPKRSLDEHIGFELSSSPDSLLAEDASRASRTFDEFSTAEPFTSTIESSFADKQDHDELLLTTVESITEALEHALRSLNKDYEDENIKREIEVELTTSFMPSFTSTSSAVAPELYTSTPLTVVPKVYTSESSTSTSTSTSSPSSSSSSSSTSTSTSTEKYTGLLTDDDEEEVKQQQKPKKTQIKSKVTTTKRPKIQSEDQSEEDFKESQPKVTRTTTRKSKIQPTDPSEEDPKESQRKFSTTKKSKVQFGEDSTDASIPTAVFDQEALKKVSNVPNDFMILEENDDTIVTDLPDKLLTVTKENQIKQKPLTQGSTLLLFLLAALLFCACLMASTLAFVKSRHSLKRKSRITEMEAHLDDHYPHPFIFPQHHGKQ